MNSSKISGIIPAYAGSTPFHDVSLLVSQDHPRIRGEHDTPLTNVTPFTGSSPHTRGARQAGPQHGVRERIIPAYAGSTVPARRIRQGKGIIPAYAGSTVKLSYL